MCTFCSQNGGFVCLPSVLRIRYTYFGKSMGPAINKAMGFRDRYLDDFVGVTSLCVSFMELQCRKDNL